MLSNKMISGRAFGLYLNILNMYFNMEQVENFKPVYNTDGDKLVFDPKTNLYSTTKEHEDIGENYEYHSKETWSLSPSIVNLRVNQGILSYDDPKALTEESPNESKPCDNCDMCKCEDKDEELDMSIDRLILKVNTLQNKVDELLNILKEE